MKLLLTAATAFIVFGGAAGAHAIPRAVATDGGNPVAAGVAGTSAIMDSIILAKHRPEWCKKKNKYNPTCDQYNHDKKNKNNG